MGYCRRRQYLSNKKCQFRSSIKDQLISGNSNRCFRSRLDSVTRIQYGKIDPQKRVVDPDPYWIRIQSGLWIRIRIRIRNPDPGPDPGGQK
jgi:hypothetical protein